MLTFDDARWGKLQSTYGDGRRVSGLLSTAASGAPKENWYDDLFQELCHQYSVSEAAYAALPHLVALAAKPGIARNDLLVLIGACFASAQLPDAPPIPVELQAEWDSAARQAIPLLGQALAEHGISESELRYLLFAIAALQGNPALAYFIEGFDSEIECPNCGYLIDALQSNLTMLNGSDEDGK